MLELLVICAGLLAILLISGLISFALDTYGKR